MAIRASCDAPGHYGLAALADFVVLRSFDDLLGAGRALGEMAIRHFFEQYPIALKVSMPSRQREAKSEGYERQGNARKPASQFWLRNP